jgi:hypothetical protein
MMFPNVPSMWPGLPMPPRLRPKCKDCGTPTELLFLFEGEYARRAALRLRNERERDIGQLRTQRLSPGQPPQLLALGLGRLRAQVLGTIIAPM